MTEKYQRSPEQRIIPEGAVFYPFSDQALLALAMIELGQGEPQQVQELAIKVMAEGLRTFTLNRIEAEKKGKRVLSYFEQVAIFLSQTKPQEEKEEIKLGPFLTSASTSQTLGLIASEAAVVFIKRLIIQNLDQPEQRELIDQMKREFKERGVRFSPQIGVVRTLVGLCSGHPPIENSLVLPRFMAIKTVDWQISDRFSLEEHQQAFAQSFLEPKDLAVILGLIDHPQPETQLPKLSIRIPGGDRIEVNWHLFLTEALVRLTKSVLADQRPEYAQQAIQAIQAQRKHD